MGDQYTSKGFVDRQRVTLKDNSLLYGKLYGYVYERNVSIRFIVTNIHGWIQHRFTAARGELLDGLGASSSMV